MPSNRSLQGVRACVFDAYGTLFDFASAAARCPDVPEAKRAPAHRPLARQAAPVHMAAHAREPLRRFLASDGRRARFHPRKPRSRIPLPARAPDGALSRPRAVSRGSRGPCDLARGRVQNRHPLQWLAPDARSACQALEPRSDVRRRPLGRRRRRVQDPPQGLSIRPRLARPRGDAISFQSSNAWDAHGASDFGMRVVWCNRYGQRRERLPGSPDFEIRTLAELPALLKGGPG